MLIKSNVDVKLKGYITTKEQWTLSTFSLTFFSSFTPGFPLIGEEKPHTERLEQEIHWHADLNYLPKLKFYFIF